VAIYSTGHALRSILYEQKRSTPCPSCPITIELLREETALASGEYLIQKKQTDTVGQGDEEFMVSQGIIRGCSCAR